MKPPRSTAARVAAPTAVPWLWLMLVAAVALVYVLGLNSFYAPTNGDEMVYIHIARMTAESGHWLPLQSGIVDTRNTKPPLLFWQAMAAGNWGHNWSLWALRVPSILYTFVTTGLLAYLAQRISGQWRTGCVAAALYLLFFSTFRYGRVYLTSAPETFWLALPMFWMLWQQLRHAAPGVQNEPTPPNLGFVAYTLCGIAMGLGAAYKSFALVAPAAAALWCAILANSWPLRWPVLIRTTLGVTWSTLIGVGIFALWFVLDPDPASVWQEFVVAENAGKMSGGQGYWHAALFGAYPMWTQLLAYPENGGLLFFAVLGVLLLGLSRAFNSQTYVQMAPAMRVLLVWLAVWLIIFTIPSQRSARYVIPAMPALAMVMALLWDRIPRAWFWVTAAITVPALIMLARIAWVMGDMGIASRPWNAITLIAACAGLAGAAITSFHKSWARGGTLVACLSVYATFGLMVAPLEDARVQYTPQTQERMHGARIAVPNGFTGQFERFHFVFPGSVLVPYDAEGRNTGALHPELPSGERLQFLLREFDAVVWLQENVDDATPDCVPGCQVIGQRWHVKSRHKGGEITLDNLWQPQLWLFRQEWLVVETQKH